ncbi:MAG: hypothetical protein QG634_329 [Patescibacteria group bacterium]|nr:hypothetical protein [Patescibacteria group bacterium]
MLNNEIKVEIKNLSKTETVKNILDKNFKSKANDEALKRLTLK